MVKKFKLQTIITALLCSVMLLGCSNLIEDLKNKENPAPVVPVPAAKDPYLTFKGNGEFNLVINTAKGGSKAWDGTVEYSTDKSNWTVWNGDDIPAVAADGSYYIYLRGKGNSSFSTDYSNFTTISITGTATSVECNGNIMTLLDWENPDTAIMNEACFYRLFKDCKNLTKGPDLPSMNLAEACYMEMFAGCTALVTAPELPATTLTDGCYFCMFSECTSLEASPALPATTVTETCYNLMFNACSSLSSIGKISAKVIDKNGAMNSMFHSCSNIKVVETSNPDEAFLTVESATAPMAVYEMFANTKAGGVTEPVAGKSYKVDTPYLTFKGNGAFSLGCKIVDGDGLNFAPGWNGDLYYSTDKSTWTEWNGNTAIPAVASNGSYYIYLKGKNNTSFADLTDFKFTNFTLTGAATSVECNGNIMTLLNWESPETATLVTYCFAYLFKDCNKLTKAPELPATDLSVNSPMACYAGMFGGCSSLLSAPELPATTLYAFCYTSMFEGCSSLTSAPVLPALTMETACYDSMFKGCTSLVTAPVLPATDLSDECYKEMFMNCTSLTSAPVLAVTKLEDDCYCQMFEGCTSLENSPALPATVLKTGSYDRMFNGCTSLTSVGKISATSIGTENSSMKEMFKGCSKLKIVETTDLTEAFITIPNDITTGIENFDDMFTGCKEGSVETPTAGKSYKVASSSVSSNYLTFKGNDAFNLGINTSEGGSKAWNGTVEYSTDKSNWTVWNGDDITAVSSNGSYYIYLRGKNNTHFSDGSDNTILALTGAATSVECNGNIMTLLDWENPSTTITDGFCFFGLFLSCEKLSKAPDLPALKLTAYCYAMMFEGCTELTAAPTLPSVDLKPYCYCAMFFDCKKLTTCPDLPSVNLEAYCYGSMFSGCSGLISTPVLSATVMKDSCYYSMFQDCSSLVIAPDLRAVTLENNCYEMMFRGCTSLKASPELPATILAESCYSSMFEDCTNLTSIGKMGNGNTVNVSTDCSMMDMFKNCSELKIIETTASDSNTFITIGTLSGISPVSGMFYGSKDGSVVTPVAGKSYKVSSVADSPATYNINWSTAKVFDSETKTVYDKATEAKTIIIGKTSDYSSVVSGLTKVQCGETSNDAVYAYFDSTSSNEKLYVLADEPVVFTDNDMVDLGGQSVGLFFSCESASSIILDNIDTSAMTSMLAMFCNCGVTSLDLSKLDTSNVTDMSYFLSYEGGKLENVVFGGKFNTSKVTSMDGMFNKQTKLKTLDISSFDVRKVTNMNSMFGFTGLVTINLGNFKPESLTSCKMMFNSCGDLKTIFVDESVDLSSITADDEDMFLYCNSIVGGKGTKYNDSERGKTYARIDTAGTPGYFTKTGDAPYVAKESLAGTVSLACGGDFIIGNYINATVTLTKGNSANLTYKWYRDDVEVTGKTTSSYQIETADIFASGKYIKVVVSDETEEYTGTLEASIEITPALSGFDDLLG